MAVLSKLNSCFFVFSTCPIFLFYAAYLMHILISIFLIEFNIALGAAVPVPPEEVIVPATVPDENIST